MKEIICPECKTKNEEQFRFCKNCGTMLTYESKESKADFNTPEAFVPGGNDNQKSHFANQLPDEIEGVQKREMIAFLGKDYDKIYNKFLKMEYSDSKISWHWPVFFLTVFLGFFGSAIWFLYRKMFKPAIAFIVAAVLLMGIQTFLTFDVSVESTKGLISSIESIFGDDSSETVNPELFLGEQNEQTEIGQSVGILATISDIIGTVETLVGGALVAMFALHIYKKHAVGKIKEQREKHGETPYYLYTLSLSGGTSGGMLALGIVIFIVASNVFSAIPMLFALGVK